MKVNLAYLSRFFKMLSLTKENEGLECGFSNEDFTKEKKKQVVTSQTIVTKAIKGWWINIHFNFI